jgi:hypothetical protein
MAVSRGKLAALIVTLVLLTLLFAFFSASLAIWLGGDWGRYRQGLTLTLKIMWGSWLVLLAAALLTYATIMGWRYRKARLSDAPAALRRALAEGMKPSALLKTTAISFTITVILVSLLGAAVLASVLIWIIGDWTGESADALGLTLKIIWGAVWVLCIITVLVRVNIFRIQRKKGGFGPKPPPEGEDESGPDRDGEAGEESPPRDSDPPKNSQNPSAEKAAEKAP